MEILDQPVASQARAISYGGFWVRFGASFLDGIILLPITLGVTFFNVTDWKNIGILLIANVIAVGYKPFMEFYYGATLGKKAFNLQVVNADYEAASLSEVLVRNVFHIAGSVLSLIFSIVIFLDPGFADVDGFFQYSTFADGFAGAKLVNYSVGLITIVDAIVLIADDKKRSLHDKIANTYVIERVKTFD